MMIATCSACDIKNSVRPRPPGLAAKCGRCGARLLDPREGTRRFREVWFRRTAACGIALAAWYAYEPSSRSEQTPVEAVSLTRALLPDPKASSPVTAARVVQTEMLAVPASVEDADALIATLDYRDKLHRLLAQQEELTKARNAVLVAQLEYNAPRVYRSIGGSEGCGSRGGPGWRKANGKCASWHD